MMTPNDLTEGWLPAGTTIQEYLAVDAMNSSGLKQFRRSPAHFRWDRDNSDSGDTDATRFGTAVHTAILEPELFGEYAVLEGCWGKKKNGEHCGHPAKIARGKRGYCGIHDPKKGTPVRQLALKLADYTRVRAIEQAIADNPTATGFLRGHTGTIEVSGIFQDPETKVRCKIRPDRVVTFPMGDHLETACVDLKTTRKATDGGWWREIASLGYHYQAALCRRGLARLGQVCTASVIVAVESEAPHGVGCYLLDEDDVARANEEITELLARYADCRKRNEWPSYPSEPHMPWSRSRHWAQHSAEGGLAYGSAHTGGREVMGYRRYRCFP